MPDAPPPARPLESLLADRDWVRVMARRLVRDPGHADDLAQQAWLSTLERPPADGRSPRGWFATVLRRAAGRGRRDAWRRDRRERLAARSEAAPSTLDVVAQAEWHERVVRAVLELPEPYRTTVLLRYFDDLPPREVARRMGAPVETVRSRARRALAMLRARFDEQGGRDAWAPALAVLGSGASGGTSADDASWEDEPTAAPVPGPVEGISEAGPRVGWAGAALAAVALVVGWVVPSGVGGPRDAAARRTLQMGVTSPSAAAAGDEESGRLAARPAPDSPSPVAAPSAAVARVAGRVVHAGDGRPVPGARVVAVALDPAPRSADWLEEACDAEGRYALTAAEVERLGGSDVMFVGMAEGLGTEGLEGLDPFGWNPLAVGPADAATHGPTLRLVPAKRFHGCVRLGDGRPAAGAVVEAWWALGSSSGGPRLARPLARTTADGDGRFAFDGWAPGHMASVVARVPGSFPSRISDMAAGDGDDGRAEVWEEHRIPAARRLAIEVVTRDGRLLGGAEVRVSEVDVGLRACEAPFAGTWTAGPDGRVVAEPVPDVPLVVRLLSPAAGRATARAEPGAASVRLEVDLRPADADREPRVPAAAPALAEVVGPDGRPAVGVRFLRWSREDGFRGWGVPPNGGRLDPTPVEPHGWVEIVGARCASDGAPLGAVVRAIAAAPDVVVRLERDVTVEGTVEAPEGESAWGTLVRARPMRWDAAGLREDLCVASARVDERGRFRLRGLGAEPYRLTAATHAGLALSGGSVLAPSGGGRVTLRLVRRG